MLAEEESDEANLLFKSLNVHTSQSHDCYQYSSRPRVKLCGHSQTRTRNRVSMAEQII